MPVSSNAPRAAAAAPGSGAALTARSYTLAQIHLIIPASTPEAPSECVLEAEFCFEQCNIASAIIHSCISGTNHHSVHCWLFESANPDIDRECPVAELALSSVGGVLISPGCPANYEVAKERLAKFISCLPSRGAQSPSRSSAIAAEACSGAGVIAEAHRPHISESRSRSVLARDGQKQKSGWRQCSRIREFAAVAVLGAAAAIVTLHTLISYLDHAAPSGRVAENGSHEIQALTAIPADSPSPIGLLQQSISAMQIERTSSTTHAAAVPPLMPEHMDQPQREKQHSAWQRPTVLPGANFHRTPVRRSDVRAERVTSTRAPARFRTELARCKQRGFWGREMCEEEVRWKHCHPDGWNKNGGCVVQKFDYAYAVE